MINVSVTPEQAAFLQQQLAALQQAQQAVNLVFTAIVRGFGLEDATLVSLEGTSLTVRTGADE